MNVGNASTNDDVVSMPAPQQVDESTGPLDRQISCSSGVTADTTTTDIISVSYARFDTRLGNTIDYTCPSTVDLLALVDAKNLQDYCFPDGAHNNMTDTVCAILRRRKHACAHSGEAVGSPSTIASVPNVAPGEPIFATALYHQRRDAQADRGTTQRGILVLSTRPLFYALAEFLRLVAGPFFDAVPMSETEAAHEFVKACHASLAAAFDVQTGRAQRSLQPRTRISTLPTGSLDCRGTVLQSFDRDRCDQRSVSLSVDIYAAQPLTDPHFGRGEPQPKDRSRETVVGDPKSLFSCDMVLPVALPCNTATVQQQIAFGSSVKELIRAFGSRIATIHWCLLTRVPVLFTGTCAAEVSNCVRACVLLMQPFDIATKHFAPYCTLEHVDYFTANMGSNVFLALGATNAYVCHKDFVGAAKCSVEKGTVELVDSSCLKRMPRAHHRSFDDLHAACLDLAVSECYIRARCCRFNLAIIRQMSAGKGPYFDALCRICNLIDQPMDGLQSSFSASRSTTEDTDSGFLLLDENTTRNKSSPSKPPVTPDAASPLTAAASALADTSISPLVESPTASSANTSVDFKNDASGQRFRRMLADLHETITLYQEHTKRNHQLVVDVDAWYGDMCKVLGVIAARSERWHQRMIRDLSTFSALKEPIADPSVTYCPSDLCGSCRSMQNYERAQRLRIVQDYKERVFLMIDTLSKNNSRGLLRKENRYVSDLFNVPGAEGYALPTQVLLHSTPCKTVWYYQRARVSITGTIHLTRNYLLFEAGKFAIRKRHQIVPFDCVRSVARERSSVFSTTVKVMVDVPHAQREGDVHELGSADGGGGGGAARHADPNATGDAIEDGFHAAFGTHHQMLLVISNVGEPDGFYQLLHALSHRQRRLLHLMQHIAAPHRIRNGNLLGHMFVPRTVPVGLYSSQEQCFIDEIWENQRCYPVVGWSSKLLPSDPSAFSDFSGIRSIAMNAWELPAGFELVYDWRLAKEARLVDPTLRGALSDELLLKYSRVDNPYNATQKLIDRVPDSESLEAEPAVFGPEEGGSATAERGGREANAASAGDSQRPQIEFLYNSSWTATESFQLRNTLGSTVRRRLWVRVRKLIVLQPGLDQNSVDEGVTEGDDRRGVGTMDTLSTSSSDLVESPDSIMQHGVAPPEVEEDNDAR